MFLNSSVVVSVNLRVFEGGQPVPDICLSEMRQIITTALRTVFGEVRFVLLHLFFKYLIVRNPLLLNFYRHAGCFSSVCPSVCVCVSVCERVYYQMVICYPTSPN